MTHFLRRNGKTVVDLDVWKDDLSCVVCIREYSILLLLTPSIAVRMEEVIPDFDNLQEIRGEWHERVKEKGEETLEDFVTRRMKEVAKKHGLQYVTD